MICRVRPLSASKNFTSQKLDEWDWPSQSNAEWIIQTSFRIYVPDDLTSAAHVTQWPWIPYFESHPSFLCLKSPNRTKQVVESSPNILNISIVQLSWALENDILQNLFEYGWPIRRNRQWCIQTPFKIVIGYIYKDVHLPTSSFIFFRVERINSAVFLTGPLKEANQFSVISELMVRCYPGISSNCDHTRY